MMPPKPTQVQLQIILDGTVYVTIMSLSLFIVVLACLAVIFVTEVSAGCKCYVPFDGPIETVVKSPRPHTYLKASDLPTNFDWRNVNGTNYGSKVLTQQNPAVCGSCWAEAATGALSDRYAIATQGHLRINLAPQQLINFDSKTTGGSCTGGDSLKAYEFINKYGISDDTCAPFLGLNWARGFEVAGMTDVEEVRAHQCYLCMWSGTCTFVQRNSYDLYGADEFGNAKGEEEMMAEIYARGPISCSVNSDVPAFNAYSGGIINCNDSPGACKVLNTDHVVVIAGWGVDAATGMHYWVGRNSYGTQWGEGAGGGWFRLQRGVNALAVERFACTWATPAAADVQRALQQHAESIAE